MPIKIACDFCDTLLEIVELDESWELQKHREAGRIACDECENTFKEYQEALTQLEEKNKIDFETAKSSLKERYFGGKTSVKDNVKKKGAVAQDEKKPRHYFRTIS